METAVTHGRRLVPRGLYRVLPSPGRSQSREKQLRRFLHNARQAGRAVSMGLAHLLPAAFVVVGMGAVFAATAHVPLSRLIMVAEMTGGYVLIVPSMLASSLGFMVQRSLAGHLRYPRLYEAQVEGRLDSPAPRSSGRRGPRPTG